MRFVCDKVIVCIESKWKGEFSYKFVVVVVAVLCLVQKMIIICIKETIIINRKTFSEIRLLKRLNMIRKVHNLK
jgi:uncharacterized membrane protein